MKLNKYFLPIAFVLYFAFLNCNSSDDDDRQPKQSTPDTVTNSSLKVGGLYILLDDDSTFYAVKILEIDRDAVHVRTYSNNFKTEPKELSSTKLDILIGHAPISKEGFLLDNPQLIAIENVKDEELEGYKVYLEEMKKGY